MVAQRGGAGPERFAEDAVEDGVASRVDEGQERAHGESHRLRRFPDGAGLAVGRPLAGGEAEVDGVVGGDAHGVGDGGGVGGRDEGTYPGDTPQLDVEQGEGEVAVAAGAVLGRQGHRAARP